MPLYDYQCRSCKQIKEVRHGFKETFTDPCASCGGEMQRLFSAAPIVFKGSGFYVTDSRKSSGGGDAPAPKAESSTPAAATPAAPSTPAPSTPSKSETAA